MRIECAFNVHTVPSADAPLDALTRSRTTQTTTAYEFEGYLQGRCSLQNSGTALK